VHARTAILSFFLSLAGALFPAAAQNHIVTRATVTPTIVFDAYNRDVTTRIANGVRYPSAAYRRKLQGKTVVEFDVHPTGRIVAVRVLASSGFQVLDLAAVAAVRRAAPLPPTPGQQWRRFQQPLNFYL
jgi:TonB family protein